MEDIRGKINGFKTKYEMGFTAGEIEALLNEFPGIERNRFYDALGVRTVMVIDGETITYKYDVELALRCAIDKRNPSIWEWD